MNGYIEMTLLGRKRGLKFGNLAFEHLGGTFEAIEKIGGQYYTQKFTADVLYAGLLNNCLRKDEMPDFKYEEVFDFVEENCRDKETVLQISEVMKCFEQSKPLQDTIKAITEAAKEVKKKNGRGKK